MTVALYDKNYLSNPTGLLIHRANRYNDLFSDGDYLEDIDTELDSRAPLDTHYHFGDCAGKFVFLPIEEYDSQGQLITSAEKVLAGKIGYDSRGNEVWL